jgi:transcriptional regulator with XRE-family HTH domain
MRSLNVVGKKVQAVRLSKNPPITQEELAIRLQTLGWSIDRFGVSKIERGERQVTDKQVLLLADALGVKFSVLFMEMDK